MPEGPEIKRMVDDIAKAVGHRDACSVFFAFDRFKGMESALAGRRVTAVEARGKAVLVFFAARGDDGPWCVYSHNQLYGQWRIGQPGEPPKTNRQLRFAVESKDRAARLYSASDIRLLRPDALDEVGYIQKLGVDPLNQHVEEDELAARLTDRRFARRALGNLLLDQGFVAGIGNYLRSDILFDAGVHPARRGMDLNDAEVHTLARSILTLIERAYRFKGVTNDPARVERLKRDGQRHGQRRHMVFNRDGQRCYVCDTPIERIDMASRRLYLCETCQPPP